MNRLDRFWERVDTSGDCWVWTGATSGRGYGHFWIPPNMIYSHRFSFEMHHGAIPDGLEINHICRNIRCVNPAHLEAVTHYENVQHSRPTQCGVGHPFSESNTYTDPRGWRQCRICQLARQRRYMGREAA